MQRVFLIICGMIILGSLANPGEAQYVRGRRGKEKKPPITMVNPDGPIGRFIIDVETGFDFGGANESTEYNYDYTPDTIAPYRDTTYKHKWSGGTGEFRMATRVKYPITPMLTLMGGLKFATPGITVDYEGEIRDVVPGIDLREYHKHSISRKPFSVDLGVRIHL